MSLEVKSNVRHRHPKGEPKKTGLIESLGSTHIGPFQTQTIISELGIYEFMNFGIGTNVVIVHVNSLNKIDPFTTLLLYYCCTERMTF